MTSASTGKAEIQAFTNERKFSAPLFDPALPRLSVILPSYNQAGFIERTLNSIINQAYPNLELIVLDGGSTDGSQAIIERYRPFLTHFESGPDGGQAAAINKGFALATGDFIAWQNSDDLYMPGFFSAVADCLAKNRQADLIIANAHVIGPEDDILWTTRYGPFRRRYLELVGWNLTSQSLFIRRDLAQAVGPLPDMPVAFDWEWLIRVARLAQKPAVMARVGGCYRIHPDSKLSAHNQQSRQNYEDQVRRRLGVPHRGVWFFMERIFLLLQNKIERVIFYSLRSLI